MLHATFPADRQADAGVDCVEAAEADVYRGAPEALIAACLVSADQLPGAPGRSKARVTIAGPLPKIVRRAGRELEILVAITPAEAERRRTWRAAALRAWVAACKALRRPARLPAMQLRAVSRDAVGAVATCSTKTAWSRPCLMLVR